MGSDWTPEPVLRLIAGTTPDQSFSITVEPMTIGRQKDCTIVLIGDSRISKNHAQVRRDGLHVFLRDNGSTNGTTVNGEYLRAERRLRNGDQIKICDHVFSFHSALVTMSDDDESKIIGQIDVATSSRLVPKHKAEERLNAILDISRDLGNTLHLREVLEKTLGSLFRIFPQAERGFILMRQKGGTEPIVQAVKHRENSSVVLTVSNTVFAHVMERGSAILSENLVDDSRFGTTESIQGSQIRTMMGVPLMDQAQSPIGMIQIDTCDQKSRFSQEDLDLLVAIAGPVGLAVENANLHEDLIRFTNIKASLQNAREVQMAMLPSERPNVPGYEFFDAYEPADIVGGDYYDYLPLNSGGSSGAAWAITLGDVSGHGMHAALLMAKLVSEARMALLTEPDPVLAVEKLNRQLVDDRFPDRFITFLGTILDPLSNTLTIVNAGHMGPIIRRASGQIEVIAEDSGGPPLALYPGIRYRASTAKLGVGDVVVLYTDGVHESMNHEDVCLGATRLKKTILAAKLGAENIGEAILKAVRQHAAGCTPSDDLGIVCIGRV